MSAGGSRMQSVDSGEISVRTRDLRLAMIKMAVVFFFLWPVNKDMADMVMKSWWSPPSEDNRSPEFAPWWKKQHMRWLLGSSAFSPSCRAYRLLWTSSMEDLKDNSFQGGEGGKGYSKWWQPLQWRGDNCDKEKVGPGWPWWPEWPG